MPSRTSLLSLVLACVVTVAACNASRADTPPGAASDLSAAPDRTADMPLPSPASPSDADARPETGLLTDIKLYFTAPLRWDGRDWALFGGALLAVAAAHHYDTQVRTHFVKALRPGELLNSDDLQDAIPTVAVVGLTWGAATLLDDANGRREAGAMVEAAALSSVTAYALKYIIARTGPDQTSDPNQWFKGGSRSFPSWHSSAAFAVGTVLAESGSEEYRWLRRLLGYGLGVVTSYERLKHDAHWLSDTVAGGAIGAATADFTMHRRYAGMEQTSLAIVPVQGGVMLAYRLELP